MVKQLKPIGNSVVRRFSAATLAGSGDDSNGNIGITGLPASLPHDDVLTGALGSTKATQSGRNLNPDLRVHRDQLVSLLADRLDHVPADRTHPSQAYFATGGLDQF